MSRKRRTVINLLDDDDDDDDDDDVIIVERKKKRGKGPVVVNLVEDSSSSTGDDDVILVTESPRSADRGERVSCVNDIDQRFENLVGKDRTRMILAVLPLGPEKDVDTWRKRREGREGTMTLWALLLAAWEKYNKPEPQVNLTTTLPQVLIHKEAHDIITRSALEYAAKRLAALGTKPKFDARIDKIEPLTESSGWTCSVCFDSYRIEDVVFCESTTEEMHGLCKPCFRHFCIQCSADKSLGSADIGCPDPKCSARFSRENVLKCVSTLDVANMDERSREKADTIAIGDSTRVRCPCGSRVLISKEEQKTSKTGFVTCPRWPTCTIKLCVTCGAEYHPNQSCYANDSATQKKQREAERKTASWLREMTKLCPKCRQPVEKAEGCMHVTCRCGAQWCYLCTGSFPNCHCGHFEQESKREALRLHQQEMNRAVFRPVAWSHQLNFHQPPWVGGGGDTAAFAFSPFPPTYIDDDDDNDDDEFIPQHHYPPPHRRHRRAPSGRRQGRRR